MDSPPTPADDAEADNGAPERIAGWLEARTMEPSKRPDWMRETIRTLGSNFEVTSVGLDDGDPDKGYYILTERHRETRKPVVDAAAMDGSDESGSFTSTGVTLSRHLDGVGERAGHIAERLGLSSEIVEDLRLAGRLHDLGKVDTPLPVAVGGRRPRGAGDAA